MSGIANRAILSIVLAVGILNAFIHSLAFADFSVYGCSSVYSLIRQRRLLEFLISPLILKSPSDIIQFLFIDLICLEMILSSLSFHSTSRKKDVSDWSWDNSNNNSGNSNRRYSSKQHRLLQHLLVPKVNNVWKSLPVLIMLMLWSFVTVSVFRIILGLLFFRSTGWSMPQLFFHSSHYECLNGKLINIVCSYD